MCRRGENIRKRKDGRWEGRYYMYVPLSGKKMNRSVYAKTYAEVKEKLLSAKTFAESVCAEADAKTEKEFGLVALQWLGEIETSKKHATYIKYRSIYEKYIREAAGGLPLSEISSAVVEEIFQDSSNKRILSENMKKSIACILNQILSYAESHYHIQCFRYSCPKQSKRNKPAIILNQTEQAKLLQYLYEKTDIYKVGVIICIYTGLRLGEICSLKWTDIDLKRKVLHVNTSVQRIAVDGRESRTALVEGEPKSVFSKREIPLSEDIVTLLAPYHTNSVRYVVNGDRPMEPRTYQNKFHSYLKMAGVEKRNFHILRHTFATNCINSGTDIKSLSEILGHSDVKITLNRYVHPAFETKRQYMNSLSSIYGQMMGQK